MRSLDKNDVNQDPADPIEASFSLSTFRFRNCSITDSFPDGRIDVANKREFFSQIQGIDWSSPYCQVNQSFKALSLTRTYANFEGLRPDYNAPKSITKSDANFK